MIIKELKLEDRPREKMLRDGFSALSDAELIAILIGSGNTEESAVQLSQRILKDCDHNLNTLAKRTIDELCDSYLGIGPAKAISIAAALELGRRRKGHELPTLPVVSSSADAYELKGREIGDLQHEEMWVLLLSQRNQLKVARRLGAGTQTAVLCDVKDVIREAVQARAHHVILMHNHPSGVLTPSARDQAMTQKVKAACELLDMKLMDHLVVGPKGYYSFCDEGIL